MKKRLVLNATTTGTDSAPAKVVLAMQLRADDNQVDVWAFEEAIATDDFYKQLMETWREGTDIEFPENQHIVRDLAAASDLLPEGYKADRDDVVKRAQNEWLFAVLSTKAFAHYRQQIEEYKEKVDQMLNYDKAVWDELKDFWGRIQDQSRERNIFREHADQLRDSINVLFEKLKTMRADADLAFEEQSREGFEKINSLLTDIEERIQSGKADFNRLFNDLKTVQSEYHSSKLGRQVRNELWERIDNAFKKLKDAKYGNQGSQLDRLGKRITGLEDVMNKMRKSIKFDQEDIDFADKRASSGNASQMEIQLREAKLGLVRERLASKKEKLADMQKTLDELNAQYTRLEERSPKAPETKPKETAPIKSDAQIAFAAVREQLEAVSPSESAPEETTLEETTVDVTTPEVPTAEVAAVEEATPEVAAPEETTPEVVSEVTETPTANATEEDGAPTEEQA